MLHIQGIELYNIDIVFYNIFCLWAFNCVNAYICTRNNWPMDKTLDNLHSLVLNIGRKRCDSGWNYTDVCSPFTRIYYIIDGTAEIDTPTGTIVLRPGYLYIIPAFTPHNCHCRLSFEHIYIHFYNEGAAYILEDWDFPEEIKATDSDIAHLGRLLALCPDMQLDQIDPKAYDNKSGMLRRIEINKQRPFWKRIESRGLLYMILSTFVRHARLKSYVRDQRISAALSYIRANLNGRIDLETLAEKSNLSKDHTIRLFKREMHTTPGAYIIAKKIEQAQLMLVTEKISIKEIAYSLGFDDPAYFNRIFKKQVGLSPLAYRRRAEQPHD